MSRPTLAVGRRASLSILICILLAWNRPVAAASLSGRDVQIIAKALGFLNPRWPGGAVAMLYALGNATSNSDAVAIVALFGEGIQSGGGMATATAVDTTSLHDGSGYIALILAVGAGVAGTPTPTPHGLLSITAADELVRFGQCMMAVHSQPQVDIIVNRAAAQAGGINFTAAFGMLVHEI